MPGINQPARSKFIWPIVWLLGMGIITTWSIFRHLPNIEQEIFRSAQTALDSANIPNIALTVDGRNATLSGNVVNAIVKEQLVNVVADAKGIRSVNDQLTVMIDNEVATATAEQAITTTQAAINPSKTLAVNEADEQPRILEEPAEDIGPEISDIETSTSTNELPALKVQVTDGTMILSGQISNQDSLFELIRTAMTAFNANYVVNNVQVNELTEKADWLPAVNRFLPSMQALSNASIDIVESQIMVSGEATNEDEHDQVIDQALSQLSKLSLVERISVTEDSEPTNAIVQASNDTENAALKTELNAENSTDISTDKTSTDNASVDDEKQYANSIDITNENVGREIETSASRNTINIAEVMTDATATESSEVVNASDIASTAGAADPETQRQMLKMAFQSIDTKQLLFQSSSDVLTEDSQVILTKIANLFLQYPEVSIDIDGHTDASGDSVSNLKLSQLRASAVLKFLVMQGIDEQRLSANGLGDGVPIADNSTPAGRRLNRRIEFNF